MLLQVLVQLHKCRSTKTVDKVYGLLSLITKKNEIITAAIEPSWVIRNPYKLLGVTVSERGTPWNAKKTTDRIIYRGKKKLELKAHAPVFQLYSSSHTCLLLSYFFHPVFLSSTTAHCVSELKHSLLIVCSAFSRLYFAHCTPYTFFSTLSSSNINKQGRLV